MGDSMDADMLPELSAETWVWPPISTRWVQSGSAPTWSDCAVLSPELWSWQLQFGHFSIDTEGRLWRRRTTLAMTSQLVMLLSERRHFIRGYHDSIFAGHLGVCRTVIWASSMATPAATVASLEPRWGKSVFSLISQEADPRHV